ncbi:MAG: integrin alpha, partial [Myxococcota bacterium]|nr:integrin alpha [Myxococcota bacterium]
SVEVSSTFGDSIAHARDLNGDGTGDVLIGAPGASKAFLYQGSATGPDPASPSLTLSGIEAISGYGSNIARMETIGPAPVHVFRLNGAVR